jgi:hypothetical protein
MSKTETAKTPENGFPKYGARDALEDGRCAAENGEESYTEDPYGDPALFQSYKNGYEAAMKRKKP